MGVNVHSEPLLRHVVDPELCAQRNGLPLKFLQLRPDAQLESATQVSHAWPFTVVAPSPLGPGVVPGLAPDELPHPQNGMMAIASSNGRRAGRFIFTSRDLSSDRARLTVSLWQP